MKEPDKKATEQAAKRVASWPYSEITAVIERGPWTLKDRLISALAMGFVSGAVFFVFWVLVGARSDSLPTLYWPLGATGIMMLVTLIHPSWAIYLFGKIWRDSDRMF